MGSERVGVIQAGFGNSSTVVNMLRLNGFNAAEISDAAQVSSFSHLILPGVGNWGRAVTAITEGGWDSAIRKAASDGASVLGVCLGMQLLCTASAENEGAGLGLINLTVEPIGQHSRVTNVGWRKLDSSREGWVGQYDGPYYFTHSFCVRSSANPSQIATVQGSPDIVASINIGNIWGAQFHPERSGRYGLNFLRGFVEGEL